MSEYIVDAMWIKNGDIPQTFTETYTVATPEAAIKMFKKWFERQYGSDERVVIRKVYLSRDYMLQVVQERLFEREQQIKFYEQLFDRIMRFPLLHNENDINVEDLLRDSVLWSDVEQVL